MFRDSSSTGVFVNIGNTSGTQMGFTVLDFASYPNAKYYVEAVIPNGCTPTRSSFNGPRSNLLVGTVGIKEISKLSINAYPNPANENLNVTGITCKTSLLISDMVGKVVSEKEVDSNTELDTTKLVDGVYTLSISNKVGSSYKKIVIKH